MFKPMVNAHVTAYMARISDSVVVLLAILLFSDSPVSAMSACGNPCEKYCSGNESAGDPSDCTRYYTCVFGAWTSMPCSDTYVFDTVTCTCNYPDRSVCQGPCPTDDPNQPTIQPGLCDGVSTTCTLGDVEPDISNCEYYYECEYPYIYVRKHCTSQSGCNPGIACVFDIYTETCMQPYPGFSCDYRCVTTIAPSTPVPTTVTGSSRTLPSSALTATATPLASTVSNPIDLLTTKPVLADTTGPPITMVDTTGPPITVADTTGPPITVADTTEHTTPQAEQTTQSPTTPSPVTTAPSIKYEPLSYRISHNGSFSSVSGDVFSQSCTLQYSDDFNQQVDQMSREVNERIGLTVCVGKTTDDVRVLSASSSMVINGNQGTTFQFWILKFSQSQSIGDVDQCAVEMSNFLLNHQNWPDPILPGVPGCPGAQFNPTYFTVVAEVWVCDGNPKQLKDSSWSNILHNGRTSPSMLNENVSVDGKVRYSTNDLGYIITHNGLLSTNNGQALSAQCNYAYSSNLQRSTAEQIVKTNNLIGSQLCSGKSFNIVSGSASLTTNGNTTLSRQVYTLRPSVSTYFEDVYACANAISAYLRPHSNWDQPIISPEAGCPTLIYDPPYYTEGGQSWSCG